MPQDKTYTVYIQRDPFADPQKYPNGEAWSSGILDINGVQLDGHGDIATYEEARELLLNTLERLV